MKKKKRTPPLLTAQPRMTWLPCRPTRRRAPSR
jgi:hypothetical protein